MSRTILYFHGFKSSSNSGKAQEFKNFIENHTSQTSIVIPDLDDDFKNAIIVCTLLISKSNDMINKKNLGYEIELNVKVLVHDIRYSYVKNSSNNSSYFTSIHNTFGDEFVMK